MATLSAFEYPYEAAAPVEEMIPPDADEAQFSAVTRSALNLDFGANSTSRGYPIGGI